MLPTRFKNNLKLSQNSVKIKSKIEGKLEYKSAINIPAFVKTTKDLTAMLSLDLPGAADKTSDLGVEGKWRVEDLNLCESIPPHSPYGVSFHLPEWQDMVKVMEHDPEIRKSLLYGYPRVFVHDFIKKLNREVMSDYKLEDFRAWCFPSSRVVKDCLGYLQRHAKTEERNSLSRVRCEEFVIPGTQIQLHAILYPGQLERWVIPFWQNTGENNSARFAAYCLRKWNRSELVQSAEPNPKFMKRTSNCLDEISYDVTIELQGTTEYAQQHELEIKSNIKQLVAKELGYGQLVDRFPSPDDVYLFPTGMSAIYNALRLAHKVMPINKCACFGFPFKDTKKVLNQFGPGLHFFGYGEVQDLQRLETLLISERINMLICEFPTNPLLKSPDLLKLRALANQHNFILVLDATLGNMLNLQDHGIADIIISSLTKIFSGYSDVMGGSLTFSPASSRYQELKSSFNTIYEDNLWCEEALTLERNSKDLYPRCEKANYNSEKLADFLHHHPLVKKVNYPKFNTPDLYHQFQRPNSGYGSLISFELHDPNLTTRFFNRCSLPKGPSLGTNFTLLLPYTILAHFKEMDYVKPYGITQFLVRVSVGLEECDYLIKTFDEALQNLN